MELTKVAIDLAKNVFAVAGADARGRIVLRKQLRRGQLAGFIARLAPCEVAMEACGGAQFWARRFQALGHRVVLLSPATVRPYRTGNKTDRNDAAAIVEAMSRPSLRPVALKTVAQQDTLALHRMRSLLLKHRTALSNHMRGLLAERGIVFRQGIAALKRELAEILTQDNDDLSSEMRVSLRDLSEMLRALEQQIGACEGRLARKFAADERCQRIEQVPGVGTLIATALVATVGNAREFRNGRELSAFLGLTPGQHSSGGKTQMGGITKRGDRYLRTIMIHGARAALRYCPRKRDPRSLWLARLAQRRGPNVAAVALANHNARIIWALLSREENYREPDAAVFRADPPKVVRRVRHEKLLVVRD